MKKLSIIIFSLILMSSTAYSQDTSIVKYMPLKVGNKWIYNSSNGGAIRIRITGTMNANGHTYYIFDQAGPLCNCSFNTYSPFLIPLQPMRVDSISGIILDNGDSCCGHINECMIDSLKSRLGDTNKCSHIICLDTVQQNVFGVLRKSKTLGNGLPFYGFTRTYSKDIGLFHSYQGCAFGISCTYSLTGAFIDGIVYGDTSFLTGIVRVSSEIPNNFSLSQNYPNPFNPSTNIKFQAAKSSNVKLAVYDALGKEVKILVDKKLEPGEYQTDFDGTNLPSGVYYYKLTAGDFIETKKMVLMK